MNLLSQVQNFIAINQSTILMCFMILVVFSSALSIVSLLRNNNKIYTNEEIFKMPEEKVLEVKQKHIETRYLNKKTTDNHEDLDRFGRFRITCELGESKTRVGLLSNILKNNNVKSYREIK